MTKPPLVRPQGVMILRVWPKDMRVGHGLRHRNPKGYVEFVRDIATQNNGERDAPAKGDDGA
jgi:hypothetical protein